MYSTIVESEFTLQVDLPVELSQYGKLAYCVLHARCSQYIAVLQYRCGYY